MDLSEQFPLKRQIREMSHLAARHIFLPINAIIFSVVALLVIFGNMQEGLFLGAIVGVNILMGFAQDVRAWLTLERLQLLTAFRITRINADGTESNVLLQDIQKNDTLRISLGDQVPCDSELLSTTHMEVNEGLITGESTSFNRKPGDALLAGSVVTAGSGLIRVKTAFAESAIAKMTEGLKRYTANPSPIQVSIQEIIRYTVYVLLGCIVFVVVRGMLLHQEHLIIVEQIGALASILVPQGLIVSVTLLFTFGAAHFYNRHVLLQEVNATEKFGHIKNLCMDKTGTLTENTLTVERMESPHSTDAHMRTLAHTYVKGSRDESQIIRAIDVFLAQEHSIEVLDTLAFSSDRRYGAICVPYEQSTVCIRAGAPDVFFPYLAHQEEKAWLAALMSEETRAGKHILCIVRSDNEGKQTVPQDISSDKLSIVAVFILQNKLRVGIQDAINFFQNRGVVIRILSGDHPETVRAIAQASGIHNTDQLITGDEMKDWSAAEYAERTKRYVIFARLKPEQKEKCIDAFKLDGFTAMVGDGANDALSLKKADLGIAMAEGAAATRQIAAVVLTKNSFVELPNGVRLADSMIDNIEIFASIFLNQTFISFLLFVVLSLLGDLFPLTPLNISFVNYFTVGLPGILISYWAINPRTNTAPVSKRPFLERVIPVPLVFALLQTAACLVAFSWAQIENQPVQMPLLIVIAIVGYAAFALIPGMYHGIVTRSMRLQILALSMIELAIFAIAIHLPIVQTFFALRSPVLTVTEEAIFIGLGCAVLLLLISPWITSFTHKQLALNLKNAPDGADIPA